jgi:acyl dehydratase
LADESTKLNRKFLGKEYHSGPHIVEAASIRNYALATNEKNPLYLGENPETHSPIYPVVFLPGILSQLVDDAEEMNLNMLRAVHAEHKISWRDAIHLGDEIYTLTKLTNMEKRGNNEIFDLLVHCKRDDDIVVEMNYRLLVRGESTGKKKPSGKAPEPEKGKLLVKYESVVTADQGLRYAEASGDHNPIHKSDEIAKSVGLPRAILHGLCTMALASQAIVEGLLECDPKRLKSMGVRFSRPVLMDQILTTEVHDGGVNEKGLHVVHFETRDENDTPVLIHGTAEYSD